MARAATTKLKVNAPLGGLPVLAYHAPEQLLIDETYQRSIEHEGSQALIRRIAVHWDWAKCQPLAVSRRPDGGLYVVDGQHRLAAARLRDDINQLPCVVTSFDSAEQEAAMFVALNQQRRPLNALELFKAAIAANDFEACQIVQCVNAAGLHIANHSNYTAWKDGGICNIGGLQRCYRVYGIQVLESSLKALAVAYPRQVLRYAGSIFPGIVAVIAAELGLRTDQATLPDRVGAFVGKRQQHEWYREFALAIAEDPTLKRAAAAEKVMRRDWSAYNRHRLPASSPPAHEREVVENAPLPTYLLPAEREWCEQCDQMVSGARAALCRDQFCKLKSKEAKAA